MKKIDKLLELLKNFYGLKFDNALIQALGIKRGTLDTWKNKDAIPLSRLKEISEKTSIPVSELVSIMDGSDIKETFGTKLDNNDVCDKASVLKIPYYKDIRSSAGFGALNGRIGTPDEIMLPKSLLINASNLTEAIMCTGDSMTPSLEDGDIMFVDRSQIDIVSGEIYVLRVEDDLYVKKLFKVPNKIIAKSDNANYPEFDLVDNFEVLGRVIYRMEKV